MQIKSYKAIKGIIDILLQCDNYEITSRIYITASESHMSKFEYDDKEKEIIQNIFVKTGEEEDMYENITILEENRIIITKKSNIEHINLFTEIVNLTYKKINEHLISMNINFSEVFLIYEVYIKNNIYYFFI